MNQNEKKQLVLSMRGDTVDQIIPVTPDEGFVAAILYADSMPSNYILNETIREVDFVVILKERNVWEIISDKHDIHDLSVEIYDYTELPDCFKDDEDPANPPVKIGYCVNEFWNYDPEPNGTIYPYTVTVGVAYERDREFDGQNFSGSHDGYSFDIYDTLCDAVYAAKKLSAKICLSETLSEDDVEQAEAMIGKENVIPLSMTEKKEEVIAEEPEYSGHQVVCIESSNEAVCPVCHEVLADDEFWAAEERINFCSCCGTKLNWKWIKVKSIAELKSLKIKRTFGDKVRSMSNEEIVDWLFEHDKITEKQGRLTKEQLLEFISSEVVNENE